MDLKSIGVIGAGAMGSGIAQVAASAGHPVIIYDTQNTALEKAKSKLLEGLQKLQEKGKIENAQLIFNRFAFTSDLNSFKDCEGVIEAIVENLAIKKQVFSDLEKYVKDDCWLATNTSSLSVTAIAAACKKPERVLGLHFFNPPTLMALVEIVPAIQTNNDCIEAAILLMKTWGKIPVVAQDTPGFIVNRIARPFYGEALRIYEEGIADKETIDWAMTHIGGFKMGPFALMDYIGHDVNYVVTETVFQSFFYDPRYRPSFTQKKLLEAGWLGKKSGRGFYNYMTESNPTLPTENTVLGTEIVERIVALLMNEAVDAAYLKVATKADIETAMTKGVNYPKGLLKWADEWGKEKLLTTLDNLYNQYHEPRYRASIALRK